MTSMCAEFADFLFETPEKRDEWLQHYVAVPRGVKPRYHWNQHIRMWSLMNERELLDNCRPGWPNWLHPQLVRHTQRPPWNWHERWPGAGWHRMDGFAGRTVDWRHV